MFGRVKAQRRKTMAAVRGKNTKPELALRKLLFARGLRFRLHGKNLPGRPDIVFPSEKVAVFCDGDFWHGRHWERRKELGKYNFKVRRHYWLPKIARNVQRDAENNLALRKMGWVVMRFWETDIKKKGDLISKRVEVAVLRRRRL